MMSTFPERIKRLVDVFGYDKKRGKSTMVQFAKILEIHPNNVNNWLRGDSEMTDTQRNDICRRLKISRAWLDHDIGDMIGAVESKPANPVLLQPVTVSIMEYCGLKKTEELYFHLVDKLGGSLDGCHKILSQIQEKMTLGEVVRRG